MYSLGVSRVRCESDETFGPKRPDGLPGHHRYPDKNRLTTMNSSIDLSFTRVRQLALGFALSSVLVLKVTALPVTQSSPLLVFQDIVALGTTLSAGQSFSETFSIVNAGSGSTTIIGGYANAGQTFSDLGGYVPLTPLSVAKAYFYIRDANQGNDTARLSLGGSPFFDSNTGSGNTHAILEGMADLSLLQTNGQLSYAISQMGQTGGSSFIVDYVQLQVVVPAETSPVPEGGMSLALLSVGLAALVVLKRASKQ